jgi:putative glutathione S-transferase
MLGLKPLKGDEVLLKPTADGSFIRPESAFRNFISNKPGSQFPAEKDRYVLYLSPGCPWVRCLPSHPRAAC